MDTGRWVPVLYVWKFLAIIFPGEAAGPISAGRGKGQNGECGRHTGIHRRLQTPPFSTLFCPVRIQFRLHLAQMLLAGRRLCVQAVALASRSGSCRSRFTGSLPVLSIFLSPLVKSDVLFIWAVLFFQTHQQFFRFYIGRNFSGFPTLFWRIMFLSDPPASAQRWAHANEREFLDMTVRCGMFYFKLLY